MDNKSSFNNEEKTYEPVKNRSSEDSSLTDFLSDIAQLIEASQWDTARNTCDYAMRFYPQNERLNCFKLMVMFKVKSRESLRNLSAPFDSVPEFSVIMNGSDEELKRELLGYIEYINKRNENDRFDAIYRLAVREMNSANTPEQFNKAYGMFMTVLNYSNSAVLAENCKNEADRLNKNRIYANAKKKMNSDNLTAAAYIEELQSARNLFLSIPGWMDADSNAAFCLDLIERTKNKQEYDKAQRKKKGKKIVRRIRRLICFLVPFAAVVAIAVFCWEPYIEPGARYLQAEKLMKENKFLAAVKIYDELDGFSDSTQKIATAFKGELALYIADGELDRAESLVNTAEYYKISQRNMNEMYKSYYSAYFSTLEVGDEIYFGEYEQTKSHKGNEAVKWIVLDKTGKNELLLISAYIIDNMRYAFYYDDEVTSWQGSYLRNRCFDSMFSSYERLMIKEGLIDDVSYSSVYVLSPNEVKQYADILKAKVTEYAYSADAYVSSSGYGNWWLRNPEESEYSYYVDSDGKVQSASIHDYCGWRPVITIKY